MSEFESAAELSLSVPNSELAGVRSEIEGALSNIAVGVDAELNSGPGGRPRQPRDPESGQFEAIEGVEQRLLDQQVVLETIASRADVRNEHLEAAVEFLDEIEDEIGGGFGSGGGGGGGILGIFGGGGKAAGGVAGSAAGGAAGGGVGLSALGIGGGVGLAGLGLGAGVGLGGAGVGLAKGTTDLPDEINVGNVALTLGEEDLTLAPSFGPENFDFNPEFGPDEFDFAPVFEPEMFNIDTRVNIGSNAFRVDPTFGPEKFDFNPEIGSGAIQLGPENFEAPRIEVGDITIDPNIDLSASLDVRPTVNVTGVEFSGGGGQIADEVINSRTFQNELESELSSLENDIMDRIRDIFNRR